MKKLVAVTAALWVLVIYIAMGGGESQDLRAEVEKYVIDPCMMILLQKLKKTGKLEALDALPNAEILRLLEQHGSLSSEALIEATLEVVSGQNLGKRRAFYSFALTECTEQAERAIANL